MVAGIRLAAGSGSCKGCSDVAVEVDWQSVRGQKVRQCVRFILLPLRDANGAVQYASEFGLAFADRWQDRRRARLEVG